MGRGVEYPGNVVQEDDWEAMGYAGSDTADVGDSMEDTVDDDNSGDTRLEVGVTDSQDDIIRLGIRYPNITLDGDTVILGIGEAKEVADSKYFLLDVELAIREVEIYTY